MSETLNEEKREPLEFYIEDDQKLVFPTLAYSTLTSSDELCLMAKAIFQNFADYYGTSVNFNPSNGQLSLCVHFAQIENQEDGKYYAFEPNSGKLNGAGTESGLRRIQQFDRTISEGNKFSITEDGKSAMAKYMNRMAKDGDGNVRWNAIGTITQYCDPAPLGSQPVICNVINNVSPIAVLRELYGDKARLLSSIDENGKVEVEEVDVDYDILVLQSLQQPGINGLATPANEGPFKIDIRMINKQQLKKSAKEVGMNLVMGRNIIK